MIILRLVHIVAGVFWAGTLLFVVSFLEPSVRAAGPDGAKVMQGLLRRRYLTVMPVVAWITILSGLDLMRRVSGGFSAEWFGSGPGKTLTLGGVVTLVAFVIGVWVMRPSMINAMNLMRQASELGEGPERDQRLAEAQALRRRSALAGRYVAGLLLVATATMAVARYVQ